MHASCRALHTRVERRVYTTNRLLLRIIHASDNMHASSPHSNKRCAPPDYGKWYNSYIVTMLLHFNNSGTYTRAEKFYSKPSTHNDKRLERLSHEADHRHCPLKTVRVASQKCHTFVRRYDGPQLCHRGCRKMQHLFSQGKSAGS